jgi:hypothetical protein
MNNPMRYVDPLGMDTIPIDDLINWQTFDTENDVIELNEVNVTPEKKGSTSVVAATTTYVPYSTQGGNLSGLGMMVPEFILLSMGRSMYLSPVRAAAGAVVNQSIKKGGIEIGKSFGKLGVTVSKPTISISNMSAHAVNQAITRGVSTDIIRNTVSNPSVVLQQTNGTYLFLTKEAAVVINSSGRLVTTYPSSMFDIAIKEIINLF